MNEEKIREDKNEISSTPETAGAKMPGDTGASGSPGDTLPDSRQDVPETGNPDIFPDTSPPEKSGNSQVLKLPRYSIVLYAIAGLSILIYIAAVIYTPFADFFSRHPGAWVRGALACLTSWIPFSLAECVLLFLPVIIFFTIRAAIKKYSDTWRNTAVFIGTILSVASVFLSVFALGFGPGYHTTTLDRRLGLDRREVSVGELYNTALILAGHVNEEAKNITFRHQNFSVMPYSLEEMNEKLIRAYDRVCDEYDFIPRLYSRVKPVMLSEAMSYLHTTGVYTYFTGEANLNVNFPDYTLPYTAAHELAHQRGIAREDEANFIAFLVCIASDDPYIRYSGYLNLYEFVSNSLYSADPDLYTNLMRKVDPAVRYEMNAYSEFFKKYKHSKAAKVSQAVNDAYLKSQGTAGTKSYGMVTDLAVAYYRDK
ncbi:MAG: DUF3810 domain-containing protein [Clostridiales bacterium]|nr:DUF3810 domain-containing protein [Clostridiales bacterium]